MSNTFLPKRETSCALARCVSNEVLRICFLWFGWMTRKKGRRETRGCEGTRERKRQNDEARASKNKNTFKKKTYCTVRWCHEPPSERRADRPTPFRENHTFFQSPPPLSLRSRSHKLRSSLSPVLASEASQTGASEVVSPDAERRLFGSAAAARLQPPRRRDPTPESQACWQAARRG